MRSTKLVGAAAMTAALAGGGVAGAALGIPHLSGAETAATSTTVPSSSSSGPGRGHDHGGRHGGRSGLRAVAKLLGLSESDLRTQLRSGTTLVEIGRTKGVSRQQLIDTLTKAEQDRLDQLKASARDRATRMVDRSFKDDGDGPGFGGRRGHMGGGMGLAEAAKVLKLSESDLSAKLRSGTSLADIAKQQGVGRDDLVKALVDAATKRIDAAVEAGDLDKARADEIKKDLSTRIGDLVDGKRPAGGPGGPGGWGGRPGDGGGMGRGDGDGMGGGTRPGGPGGSGGADSGGSTGSGSTSGGS